jgi:hypothetical protein
MLMSQRVLKAEAISFADGGMYKGIVDGTRGNITIDSKTVTITTTTITGLEYLESTSEY